MLECFTSVEADGSRRFHVPMPVRWRDLDAYGHVNNGTMFTLLEEARVQTFWTGHADHRPMAVVNAGEGADTHTLISGHVIEYRAPIPQLAQPLDIHVWVSDISAASAEVSYEIWSPVGVEPRVLYTLARSTIVFIDAVTGRPRRVNALERAAWEPYLGAPARMRADRRK